MYFIAAGWDAEEWEYVCNRLGVAKHVTERVDITFCNTYWGCNFGKCPHRDDDDQETLFLFSKAKSNATKCYEEEPAQASSNTAAFSYAVFVIFLLVSCLIYIGLYMSVTSHSHVEAVFQMAEVTLPTHSMTPPPPSASWDRTLSSLVPTRF